MAAWRRKLIELLPDEKERWEQEESIYGAFSELRNELEAAARRNDVQAMAGVFNFAEWCYWQQSKDLSNAAGVSFYEHLADDPEVAKIVGHYLDREIFEEIKGLIHAMRGPDAVDAVRQSYAS